MVALPRDLPKGPAHLVTDEWLALVRAEMAARGWSPADLARESGVSQASISRLLNGKVRTARVAVEVASVLDLQLPTTPVDGDALKLWLDIGRQLRDNEPAKFADLLAKYATKH